MRRPRSRVRGRPRGPAAVLAAAAALAAGCALHPAGEQEEREQAQARGAPYEKRFEERELPPLSPDPMPDEVLRHAFLASGELEERYWEWREALERIPQEASPRTTGALFFEHMIDGGSATFWERTLVAVGNDPMFNIPWPGKLATAGRRALEEARAAGRRFEQAKFDLQKKVLASYHDWALLAETVRIQEANAALLQVVSESAGARVSAGTAGQEESLRARTEEDLARNELEASRARVPALRARLNALLGREAEAPLSPPLSMPPSRELAYSDAEILALAAERHPELQALAREVEGGKEAIHLAELEWIPEFGVSAGTDLGGIAQSVAGMVTFPILRYEAIRAGIEEARARLRRFEARRRQAQYDVRAGAIATLAAFRDAERQSAFFRETIIPRAEQIIESARASYATGRMDWLDFVAAQRTLNDARLLLARLRAEREKLLAEIEALAAVDAERSVPTRDQPRP